MAAKRPVCRTSLGPRPVQRRLERAPEARPDTLTSHLLRRSTQKTTPTRHAPHAARAQSLKRSLHDSLTTVSRTAFTLFTKFFFTFRSRYLFTIGRQTEYLVLEGAYLPNIHASFPRCATRRVPACVASGVPARLRGWYALWQNLAFKRDFGAPAARGSWTGHCRLQFVARGTARTDFQHGLFGVQSPLLAESRLISFPPLSKMLQSSG